MLKFRALTAAEVDARIARITDKGLTLLLYKDARCDQNILDETVGPYNWQRHHSRDNANCTVSIWDEGKGQWIDKEDTGTESYTEKEKGLASDSFKRACFNWGIGRELYTAPFIWVPAVGKDGAENYKTYDNSGKPATRDSFAVTYMLVENGRITGLNIENATRKRTVFVWGKIDGRAVDPENAPTPEPKHRCCMCGKPVSDTTAAKSLKNTGKVYCSRKCLDERPIE